MHVVRSGARLCPHVVAPLLVLAAVGCSTTQALTRQQLVQIAGQPEKDRDFPSDAPLRLQTDRGEIGPKPLHTLRTDGAAVKLDDVQLQPGEIQFGEVTIPQRGRTALLIAGVTVGTAAVALLVATGVAFSNLRF